MAADNLRMDLVAGRKDSEEAGRIVRIVAGRTEAGRIEADRMVVDRMVVVRMVVVHTGVDRMVVRRDLEMVAAVVGYATTFNTG